MYLNIGGSEDQPSSHVFIEPDTILKRTHSSRSKSSSIRFSQNNSSNHLQIPASRNIYQPRLERNAHSFRFSSFYDAKGALRSRIPNQLSVKMSNKSTQTLNHTMKESIDNVVFEEEDDEFIPTEKNDKKKETIIAVEDHLESELLSKTIKSRFISIIINYILLFLFIVISACIFNHLEKKHVESMFEEENRDLIRTVAIIVNNTKCSSNSPTKDNCLEYYNISGLFGEFPEIHKIWNDSLNFEENLKALTALNYQQAYDKINISKSILFVSSVITTVGYGLFSPRSQNGRLFCVILTMFGVPLSITTSSNLAQFIMLFLRQLNINCVVFISNLFYRIRIYHRLTKKAYRRETSFVSHRQSRKSLKSNSQPAVDEIDASSSDTSDVFYITEPTKRELDLLLNRDQLLLNGLVLTSRERKILTSIYSQSSFEDNLYCEQCSGMVNMNRKRFSEIISNQSPNKGKRAMKTPQTHHDSLPIKLPARCDRKSQLSQDPLSGPIELNAGDARIIENKLVDDHSDEVDKGSPSRNIFTTTCSKIRGRILFIDRVIIARVISFLLLILIVFFIDIIAPALIFKHIESDWSFLDSVYVATISMSTVGLGDLVPNLQRIETTYNFIYEIILAGYLIFGTVLFMVILRSFHETFIHVQTQIDEQKIFNQLKRKSSTRNSFKI